MGSTAIHGIGEATRYFFKKESDDLTLSESALLSGIIKAPSYFSPIRNLERATKRRKFSAKTYA